MVRRWRGRDIFERMDTAGILDDRADDLTNAQGGRRQPSAQLVGRPDHSNLDLPSLDRLGVRLLGRLDGIGGGRAFFKGDLAQTTAKSHSRMINALQRIDRHIERSGEVAPPSEIDAIEPFIKASEATAVDLRRDGIRTVVWATGYRRDYGWLKVPVVADNGEVVQRGGVTPAPGLYILGLNYLRRRRSAFIDGCGLDAEDVANVLQAHLQGVVHRAA
jgi:putative flavoprotein involved in K+ transport